MTKAILYQFAVVDGGGDLVHGWMPQWVELYLYSADVKGKPLDVGVNLYQNHLNVVECASDAGRYQYATKLRDITWDKDVQGLAEQIQDFLESRTKVRAILGDVIEK